MVGYFWEQQSVRTAFIHVSNNDASHYHCLWTFFSKQNVQSSLELIFKSKILIRFCILFIKNINAKELNIWIYCKICQWQVPNGSLRWSWPFSNKHAWYTYLPHEVLKQLFLLHRKTINSTTKHYFAVSNYFFSGRGVVAHSGGFASPKKTDRASTACWHEHCHVVHMLFTMLIFI